MPHPPNLCPNCKAPIPPDAPAGLCPACLLLGAAGPTQAMPGALASAPSMEAVAAAFPELEIVELFGHGGMGVIFKARQAKLDRLVALKILPPDLARQPGFTERFTREARALARLNHPHIVSVFDFGERAGFCFLLMEFVNGVNLRQAMRAGVTPQQALALVPGICEALQFAHDHGVLHRDIKPENILLDTHGQPKLADFGIAKLVEEKVAEAPLTTSGAALGTAAYMAPEQIEQPSLVDHRADIYSLGVVLYEMLTGELPLGRFAAPSSKAKVSHGVDEVVFRALEKERERRQQSATEMKSQVEDASTAARTAPRVKDDDWILRCPECGHIRPFTDVGIRIGAASLGKRVLARCPACGFRGFTPVMLAGRAKADPFVPDPHAGERPGRAAAIIGLVLTLPPLALFCTTISRWLMATTRYEGGMKFSEFMGGFSESSVHQVFIPAILIAALGHVLTIIALWGQRYRAAWFFWWLVFYGACTSPLIVGVAMLITVLSRREEFFYAPDAALARNDIGVPPVEAEESEATPHGYRGFTGVFLLLAVLTALLVPLAAISPALRNIVSPVTLSYFVAIFGALFALWPVMVMPPRRKLASFRAPRRPTYAPIICGLIALPLAAFYLVGMIPRARALGISPWLPVIFSLGFPIFASAGGAIVAGIWRATKPSSLPKGMRVALAAIVVAFLPAAIFAISAWTDRESRKSPSSRPDRAPGAQIVSVVTANQIPSIGKWAQGSVELVAIARHPSTKSSWWRMDGGESRQGPFVNPGGTIELESDLRAYEFYFRMWDLPPDASSPILVIENFRRARSGTIPALAEKPDQQLEGYQVITASIPAHLNKTNALVGLGYGSWHTLSTSRPQNSNEQTIKHGGESWVVTHGRAVETKDGESNVVLNYEDRPNWESRVVAINTEGVEVANGRSFKLGKQAEWHFPKLPLAAVREFQFQVRPIRWVEFRDIALKPSF